MQNMKTHVRFIALTVLAVCVNSTVAEERLKPHSPQVVPISEPTSHDLVGREVPDFSLPGLDGKIVSRGELKGEVYVLNFWVTWCAAVRNQEAQLEKFYQEEQGNKLKIFAVNVREDKAKVVQFASDIKLTIPVLLDAEGRTIKPFSISSLPLFIVVGKDEKVAAVFIGSFKPEEMRKVVDGARKQGF
jgi:thiol-disulfide isomerase/thioredoxin